VQTDRRNFTRVTKQQGDAIWIKTSLWRQFITQIQVISMLKSSFSIGKMPCEPLLRVVIFIIGAIDIFRGLPILLKLLALVKILPPSGAIDLPGFPIFLGAMIAGIFF
jgi:hypothetical protein